MRRIALIVAIIALLGLAFAWFSRTKPIPVVLKEVATGMVEATLANTRAGTVEACLRTKLSTIIGGRIEYLGVKEGDRVKKGQLLLQAVERRPAGAGGRWPRRRSRWPDGGSNEACIAAVNAEERGRTTERRCAPRDLCPSQQGRCRAHRGRVRRASCNTAKADVAQAEAKLKATRVEQGRVVLYAPFDGTVAKIVGELGEYSTPSPPGVPTPPAIDLIDDSLPLRQGADG